MTGLKIIAFVLVTVGAVLNYGSKLFVNRLGLAEKMDVTEAREFSGEELEKYKFTKAQVRVKMAGLIILMAGALIVFIIYR